MIFLFCSRNGCIHLKNSFGTINRNSYGNCKIRTKREQLAVTDSKSKA